MMKLTLTDREARILANILEGVNSAEFNVSNDFYFARGIADRLRILRGHSEDSPAEGQSWESYYAKNNID